ncbi:MAG: hypothetical protein PVI11_02285 [Candidatus Aminicenantes bacterium]
MLWSLPAIVLGIVFVLIYVIDENAYGDLTDDYSVVENLTAFLYAVAGLALLTGVFRQLRKGEKLKFQTITILWALLFLFIAVEEKNWGQEIFHFSTPAQIENINAQDEFNLHNINIFHTSLYSPNTIADVFVIMVGIFLPFGYAFVGKIKSLCDKLHCPVVSLSLVPFFLVGLTYGTVMVWVTSHPWAPHEFKELIYSLGFFLFTLTVLRRRKTIFPD